MPPKVADGMANRVDSDQTAPLNQTWSSLIWVFTVLSELRNITVINDPEQGSG